MRPPRVEIGDDDHTHLIDPEHRREIALIERSPSIAHCLESVAIEQGRQVRPRRGSTSRIAGPDNWRGRCRMQIRPC
jgi:hypothetical protein